MWLIDQWAERHIQEALQAGDLDNLPGQGSPLCLEDDSQVPADLRTGYRLLKNAGCLPAELQLRRDALDIMDLLNAVGDSGDEANALRKKLRLLEMKLQQHGLSTEFLRDSVYGGRILKP